MDYLGLTKALFHRKAFLLVLNTIHHRKTPILYLYTVLSTILVHLFPLGKRILLSSGKDLNP